MNDRAGFEKCLARINEITGILSAGTAELEESIELYKEANGLLVKARNILAEAEVEMTRISGNAEE